MRRRDYPPCPDCGAPMVLRRGNFEGRTLIFLGCSRFPACRGLHSLHQGTLEPMGTPADEETRRWRRMAHKSFDALWRGPDRRMSRRRAYRAMQHLMGLTKEQAHIGKFNKEQCVVLINALGRVFNSTL